MTTERPLRGAARAGGRRITARMVAAGALAVLLAGGCRGPEPAGRAPQEVPAGVDVTLPVPARTTREVAVRGPVVRVRPVLDEPPPAPLVGFRLWRKGPQERWELVRMVPPGRGATLPLPGGQIVGLAFSAATQEGEVHRPRRGRLPDLRVRRIPPVPSRREGEGSGESVSPPGPSGRAAPAAAAAAGRVARRVAGTGRRAAGTGRGAAGPIEVLGLEGGLYAGGSARYVFWHPPDPAGRERPVTIALSSDGGATWRPIAEGVPNRGMALVRLPRVTADCARLRVRVVVAGGRGPEGVSPRFALDSAPPEVEIEDVRVLGRRVRARVRARDVGSAGVARLWVWWMKGTGGAWQAVERPFAPGAPVELALQPGDYGIWVAAEDRAGNRGRAPGPGDTPPRTFRIEPDAPPGIALKNFAGGGAYAGGSRRYIFWSCPGGEAAGTIRIALSADGGKTWRPIARGLENRGKYLWRLPEETGDAYRIRVVRELGGGAEVADASRSSFRIDAEAPRVVFEGPDISAQRVTRIRYRWIGDEAGGAVRLHARLLTEAHWHAIGRAESGAPLAVELPDGLYAIALVGEDEAGNAGPAPSDGWWGSDRLLVDTIPPAVAVEVEPESGPYRPGEIVTFRPRAQDENLPPFPLRVEASSDGGIAWEEVRRFHAGSRPLRFTVPDRPGLLLVRFTAEDLAGNRNGAIAVLGVLPVDPDASFEPIPQLAGGYPIRGGSVVTVRWRARGVGATPATWELALSADGGATWDRLGSGEGAGGVYSWPVPRDLESGRCRLRIRVRREDGVAAEAITDPFTVASRTPEAHIAGPVEPLPPDAARAAR